MFLIVFCCLVLSACSGSSVRDNPYDPNVVNSNLSSESVLSSAVLLSSSDKVGLSSDEEKSSSIVSSQVQTFSSSMQSSNSNSSSSSSLFVSSSALLWSSSSEILFDVRDSATYKTTVINGRVWMAENLNFGKRVDDLNSVSQVLNNSEKFCVGNLDVNCRTLGALYQWHVAMNLPKSCVGVVCVDSIYSGNFQGICPAGWHIPRASEWADLNLYFNQMNKSHGFLNTASAGQRAYSGGYTMTSSTDLFFELSEVTSTLIYAWTIVASDTVFQHNNFYKKAGLSLRCVKD